MESTLSNNTNRALVRNYKKVSAPLSINQIKEYFENKEINFLINYKASELKSNLFLTYISNLDLPCEIDFEGCSFEDIFELLEAYMTTKSIVSSLTLSFLLAQVLFDNIDIESDYLFDRQVLPKEERKKFLIKNIDLVNKYCVFINSSLLYMFTTVQTLEEGFKFKNIYPQSLDADFVGYNVVNLFKVPTFLESFFSKPLNLKLYYFKHQFEDYIFKGKNLFYYFYNSNNVLSLILDDMMSGKLDFNLIQNVVNEKKD